MTYYLSKPGEIIVDHFSSEWDWFWESLLLGFVSENGPGGRRLRLFGKYGKWKEASQDWQDNTQGFAWANSVYGWGMDWSTSGHGMIRLQASTASLSIGNIYSFVSARSIAPAANSTIFGSNTSADYYMMGWVSGTLYHRASSVGGLTVAAPTGPNIYGLSRNAGALDFYLNGTKLGSTTIAAAAAYVFGSIGGGYNLGNFSVPANGVIPFAYLFDVALTDAQQAQIQNDPYGPFSVVDEYGLKAAGGPLPIGLATETDSAFAVGAAKAMAAGLALEADSGLAVGAAKALAVGLALEADSAFPVGSGAAVAVGLALEVDAAQPVTGAKSLAVGLAAEADTALAVGSAKLVIVGLAGETDSALAATAGKGFTVGLAGEADTALAVATAKAMAAGLATEADTALAVTASGGVAVDHVRERIIVAIEGIVTGLLTTGANVYRDRDYRVPAAKMPALILDDDDPEATEPDTIGGARSLFHEFELAVAGQARVTATLDDTLDLIAAEVETAIAADPTLGGLVKDIWLSRTEIELSAEGDKPIGVVVMTWSIEYRTAEGDATLVH